MTFLPNQKLYAQDLNAAFAAKLDLLAITTQTVLSPLALSGATALSSATVAGTLALAGALTLASWTSAPSTAAGTLGFNTSTGRLEVGVGNTTTTYAKVSGDTLTGPLVLAGDPAVALGVATKQCVDAHSGSGLPLTGGTLSGALAITASGLGLSVSNNALVSGALTATTLSVSGPGTALAVSNNAQIGALTCGAASFSGAVTLAADPTVALGCATKRYVDAHSGAGAYVPLAGGTMTGELQVSAAGTGLAVANNTTVGGSMTAGTVAATASGTGLTVAHNATVGGTLTLSGALAGTTAAFSGTVAASTAVLAAAGTTQGTAAALAAQTTVVTPVTSGAGVILPAFVGVRYCVVNRGANALLIYPPTGASLEAGAVNAAVSVATGASAEFMLTSATQGYAFA